MPIRIVHAIEYLEPLILEVMNLQKEVGFRTALATICERERKSPEGREILRSEIASICSRLRKEGPLLRLLEKIRKEQEIESAAGSMNSLREYFSSEDYIRDVATGRAGDNPDGLTRSAAQAIIAEENE